MLSFQDFFTACAGSWVTERTYHSVSEDDVERSHTEYEVRSLTVPEKEQILVGAASTFSTLKLHTASLSHAEPGCPGFAIAFDTVSERGEKVSMTLKALFVPDQYVTVEGGYVAPPLPAAAKVNLEPPGDVIQGFYLRDEGYTEAGAIAGRFTYQPTRQTLEMLTYYRRSVALDQMRFVAPDMRLRTIITYDRPTTNDPATVINLVGFGVERKTA